MAKRERIRGRKNSLLRCLRKRIAYDIRIIGHDTFLAKPLGP